MEKVKSSTFQEIFGSDDEDIKATKHDEIMLWVDLNIVDIIEKSDFHRQRINSYIKEPTFYMEKYNIFPNDTYETKYHKKIWGHPIFNKGKNIVDFIDMRLHCEIQLPQCYIKQNSCASRSIYFDYYIEVKPEIKSLCKLFKQIQLHKSYAGGDYIIVSPDDKYKNIIEEQGSIFIKYQ